MKRSSAKTTEGNENVDIVDISSEDDDLPNLDYTAFDLATCHRMNGRKSPPLPASAARIFNLRPEPAVHTTTDSVAVAARQPFDSISARKQLNLSAIGEAKVVKGPG